MNLPQGDRKWWDECGCMHDRASHCKTLYLDEKDNILKGWNDENSCSRCNCKGFTTFESMIEGLLD